MHDSRARTSLHIQIKQLGTFSTVHADSGTFGVNLSVDNQNMSAPNEGDILNIACYNGDFALVRGLVISGADDVRNDNGDTPAIYCRAARRR
jgi:ankyrin repeat protein